MKKFKYIKQTLAKVTEIEDSLQLKYYRIGIKEHVGKLEGKTLAECYVDNYEKEMKITFGEECNEFSEERVMNILLHELMHGLYLLYKKEAASCESQEGYEYFEEQYINHIVRILEGLLK